MVSRDLLTAILVSGLVIGVTAFNGRQTPTTQPAGNVTAGNVTPGNLTAKLPVVDPAAVVFTTDVGAVLHAVKPTAVADYEALLVALQQSLAKTTDDEARKVAAGWRVYKATETDAKANVIYVHWLNPTLPAIDYRPSLWIDRMLEGATSELVAKYRDSFAVAPSKLSLVELANMATAPARVVNGSPAAPARNGSPK